MRFSDSLKKNDDFKNVYKKGKSYANKYLVMYVLKNNKEVNRIGISVSYRLHENIFNSGLDIVVIGRNNAKSASYAEIESALLHLGKLHHIIKIFFYEV